MSATLQRLLSQLGPLLEGHTPLAVAQEALYPNRASARPGGNDRDRLAIYQRFCASHRDTALVHVFSHCKRVIGEAAWPKMVTAYFHAHPMHHVEINANGVHFPEFLRAAPTTSQPAFLAELADFEWWEWQTRSARVSESTTPLAPTVELRPYHFDFVGWLDAPESSNAPTEKETIVVFWRDRDDDTRRENTTQEELLVLRAAHTGLPIPAHLAGVQHDLLQAGILRPQ